MNIQSLDQLYFLSAAAIKLLKMQQEKCSLRWKFFSTHLTSSISDVFTENSYSDVTLVSDDLKPFQAHKCVLSACSPVLKDLLLENPHPHPLIYLRGVKQQELQSILQFIYLGEGRFYEGNMDKFMEAVKDLQIKQLTECFMTAGNPFLNRDKYANGQNILTNIDDEHENDTEHDNVEEIQKQNIRAYNTGGESCSQLYKCEECGAMFKSKMGLMYHTRTKHEGIIYSCNRCEYQATQQSNLKGHQESKHEGVRYSCNQCEYQATTRSTLKRHQQSKHEGVIHEGVIYS